MKAVYISLDVKLTGQRIHDVMKEQGYSVRQLQEKLDLTCPPCCIQMDSWKLYSFNG